MLLKNKRARRDANKFNVINEGIVGHILGYVGPIFGARIKIVCKKFNDCKLMSPNILCPQHYIDNDVMNKIVKIVNEKNVYRIAFYQCERIEEKDLEFMRKFVSVKTIMFINCVNTDNMLRVLGKINGLSFNFLNIQNCDLTDVGISHLGRINGLEKLRLLSCSNVFTGATLYMLKDIVDFDVWKCKNFNIENLEDLIKLKKLKVFCENSKQVHIVAGLKSLDKLYLGIQEHICVVKSGNFVNLSKLMVARWVVGNDGGDMVGNGLFATGIQGWELISERYEYFEYLHIKGVALSGLIMNAIINNFLRLKKLTLDMCDGINLNVLCRAGGGKLETLYLVGAKKLKGISGFVCLNSLMCRNCKLSNSDVEEILTLKDLKQIILYSVTITEENMMKLMMFMLKRKCTFDKLCIVDS